MKKVALSLVVLFAAAMVSCGGNKENATETPGTDTTAPVENVDTAAPAEQAPVDSPATEAPADSANVQK